MKTKLTKKEIAKYYNHDYVLPQKVAKGEMVQVGMLWWIKAKADNGDNDAQCFLATLDI